MTRIWCFSLFLGPVVSTSSPNPAFEALKRNRLRLWPVAGIPSLSRQCAVLLCALACCTAFATAATGKGRHRPAPTSAPQLSLSTTALSFGTLALNTSTTQSVALTSSGTTALTVNSASISGTGFTIVAGTFPATLNPGQSLTLQLQFKPTVSGAATGQLTINSNSTTGSTAVVSLSGAGAAANSQLTLSATTLSFGSVAVNSSTSKSVTLTSTGTSSLTVNSASIAGAGFTIVGGSFPATLSPNQSMSLQVQFKPTASGSATGQLTISSNSTSGGTAVVSLSGTGTSVAHEVDLSWTAPGSSPVQIAGYNVYRAVGGSTQMVSPSKVAQTAFVDKTVTSGTTYSYTVTSVDSTGVESVPSSPYSVTIP